MEAHVGEVQRIKALEEEKRKLKQLAGEQALVIETLKEYQKNGEGFKGVELVQGLQTNGLSQRRGCRHLSLEWGKVQCEVLPQTGTSREWSDPSGTSAAVEATPALWDPTDDRVASAEGLSGEPQEH